MSHHHNQQILKKVGFCFYRYIWERVDCDYLDQLPPDEQRWMLQFLREYYQCESRKFGEKRLFTREQELEAFKRNTSAFKDLLSYHDKLVTFIGGQEEWEEVGQTPSSPPHHHSIKKKPRKLRGPLSKFIDETE